MNPPFIRSPYNYDVEKASDEAAYTETMPSLTVQSMSEDADLNVLMKRFGVTGKLPENARMPSYGDFSHITDYRSALEAARAAEADFMEFPADIRSQFENNPQLFLDYCVNPANIETLRKWFPKENLDGNRSVTPSGGAEAPQSGAGASASNGGAGVPNAAPQSVAAVSGPANRPA